MLLFVGWGIQATRRHLYRAPARLGAAGPWVDCFYTPGGGAACRPARSMGASRHKSPHFVHKKLLTRYLSINRRTMANYARSFPDDTESSGATKKRPRSPSPAPRSKCQLLTRGPLVSQQSKEVRAEAHLRAARVMQLELRASLSSRCRRSASGELRRWEVPRCLGWLVHGCGAAHTLRSYPLSPMRLYARSICLSMSVSLYGVRCSCVSALCASRPLWLR